MHSFLMGTSGNSISSAGWPFWDRCSSGSPRPGGGDPSRALAAREDLSRVWRLQSWQAVDTILSSGMVLSILLWPSARSQEVRVRGDQLRQALGVDEASPLKSRTVRHCIEHFDERLDGWLVEHGGEEIDCDFVITCDDDSVPNVPLVRRMDPRTWIVRLLGDEIDLRSLLQEVNRLKAVVITDDPPTPGA